MDGMTEFRYIGTVCDKHPELSGLRHKARRACVACNRERVRVYQATHPRKHKPKSPEASARDSKKYRQAHPDAVKARNSGNYARYPELFKLNAKVRSKRQQAQKPRCVSWSEIKEVYRNCPPGRVVDHAIPLVAKIDGVQVACGLHAPWNLQYLTPEDNDRKGCHNW